VQLFEVLVVLLEQVELDARRLRRNRRAQHHRQGKAQPRNQREARIKTIPPNPIIGSKMTLAR